MTYIVSLSQHRSSWSPDLPAAAALQKSEKLIWLRQLVNEGQAGQSGRSDNLEGDAVLVWPGRSALTGSRLAPVTGQAACDPCTLETPKTLVQFQWVT